VVHQASLSHAKGWAGPAALQVLLQAASTAGSGRASLYAGVDSIGIECILGRPNNEGDVADFEQLRAKALLLSGDKVGALAAMKGYYNVVPFARSKDAIDFLTLSLPSAYPDDPNIGRRFRDEQMQAPADSTSSPRADSTGSPQADSGQAPSTGSGQATTQPSTVLSGITVDAKPYQEAIDGLLPTNFQDYLAKANLLLVADRPQDAQDCLEIAITHTKRPSELQRGIEGIARCIRAENGNVAPANGYLQSVQQAQK